MPLHGLAIGPGLLLCWDSELALATENCVSGYTSLRLRLITSDLCGLAV